MLKTGCFEIFLRRSEDDDPATIGWQRGNCLNSARGSGDGGGGDTSVFFYFRKSSEVSFCFQFLNRKKNCGMLTFSYKIIVTIGGGSCLLRISDYNFEKLFVINSYCTEFLYNYFHLIRLIVVQSLVLIKYYLDIGYDIFYIKYQLFIQLYIIDYVK